VPTFHVVKIPSPLLKISPSPKMATMKISASFPRGMIAPDEEEAADNAVNVPVHF